MIGFNPPYAALFTVSEPTEGGVGRVERVIPVALVVLNPADLEAIGVDSSGRLRAVGWDRVQITDPAIMAAIWNALGGS